MVDADIRDSQVEWPQFGGAPHDPLLARDPALAMLEAAWRSGLLVENEPN